MEGQQQKHSKLLVSKLRRVKRALLTAATTMLMTKLSVMIKVLVVVTQLLPSSKRQNQRSRSSSNSSRPAQIRLLGRQLLQHYHPP